MQKYHLVNTNLPLLYYFSSNYKGNEIVKSDEPIREFKYIITVYRL